MPVTRRELLGAVAAGTGALAGCLSGGDGGGETTTVTTTTTATETTTATTTESTTTPTTTGSGASVVMQDRSFAPRTLSVEPGTTVTWTNADSYGHDVTSTQFHDDAASWELETETLDSGEEATHTFEEAGVYEYYCTIHGQSSMCGAILVGDVTLPGDLPCTGGYG